MTSSAASETDSARKRTPGRSGATALMIASPLPSGRWTSSRTTSGSSSLISGTASATLAGLADDLDRVAELGPHAREEELVVVDEDDARASRRHSAAAAARPRCRRPARSMISRAARRRARAGLRSTRRSRAGRPGRPHDRSPTPRSRTNTETTSSVDLDVDVDLLDARRTSLRSSSPRARRARARSLGRRSRRRSPARRARRAAPRRRPRPRRARRRATRSSPSGRSP